MTNKISSTFRNLNLFETDFLKKKIKKIIQKQFNI